MSIENYDPRYVEDLSDIPISGPDDYDESRKRKALFHAEARLELDANDGSEISADSVTDAHRLAAMNLATHVLTHAAEEPSDVTLGDMASGGGTITSYSSRYLEAYEEIVDDMGAAGTARSDAYAVAVNNGTVGDNATTSTTQ